jgi:hypothetical protein
MAATEALAGVGLVAVAPMVSYAAWDTPATHLRAALRRDGYLVLRGALPAADVRRARRRVLAALRALGLLHPRAPELSSDDEGDDANDARARDPLAPAGLLGRPQVAALPEVRHVLEHPHLFRLARTLLLSDDDDEGRVATVAYKWLRAVGRGGFTGVHTDRVYLGGGTERLVTLWVPLGHTDAHLGSMLVVPGSHRQRRFAALQRSYGRGSVGADGIESGWLSAVRVSVCVCVCVCARACMHALRWLTSATNALIGWRRGGGVAWVCVAHDGVRAGRCVRALAGRAAHDLGQSDRPVRHAAPPRLARP